MARYKTLLQAEKQLKEKLEKYGFEERNIPLIKKRMKQLKWNPGVEIDTLKVFKRKDGSNYFVFVGVKKGFLGIGNKLVVTYYNPHSPISSSYYPRQKVVRVRKISNKLSQNIDSAIREIAFFAAHKPKDVLFFSPHNHAGEITFERKDSSVYTKRLIDFEPENKWELQVMGMNRPVDDGMSHPLGIILSGAFFGLDTYAYTPHNSFPLGVYKEMKSYADELGMEVVPGTEFTMPLYEYNVVDMKFLANEMNERLEKKGIKKRITVPYKGGKFFYTKNSPMDRMLKAYEKLTGEKYDGQLPLKEVNGPHTIVLYKDAAIGKEVEDTILAKKSTARFPPLAADDVFYKNTIAELRKKYGDKVLIIAAHPFISLSLPQATGVASLIKDGDFSLNELKDMLRPQEAFGGVPYLDGIVAFNASLTEGEAKFKPRDVYVSLKEKIKGGCNGLDDFCKFREKNSKEFEMYMNKATKRKFNKQTHYINAMNMALASQIARDLSKEGIYVPKAAGSDTHWYFKKIFKVTKPAMNHLGRAYTLVKAEKNDVGSIFDAMRAHYRGERNAIDYWAYAHINDEGKMVIDPNRKATKKESQEYTSRYIENYVLHGFLSGPLGKDVFKRAFSKVKHSLGKVYYIYKKYLKG